jgi:hypothetical protein
MLHANFMARLMPFNSTFIRLFNLGDCLFKCNLGIFQINFLHVHTNFNFIGSCKQVEIFKLVSTMGLLVINSY